MSNRVLVVEDDPSLREWVNFELVTAGYDVVTAEDGHQAIDALGERTLPDIVLLDVQLPGMNGFEICVEMKNNPTTAAIPVIFLTSRSTLDDKLQGFESGAADYLPKPFTMAELKARVKALLRQAEMGRKQGAAIVEEEMAQAAAIQKNLMPRVMPQVPGVEIVARSKAAKHVGGDFFDVYRLGNGNVCLIEADVSGKGLPAAMIMTAARTALRGATQYMPSPDVVMTRVCHHLYDDLTDVEKFITAFLAYYDPAQRELRYVNAGHALAIFCPADGEPTILEADGPPLGILPSFEYSGERIHFGAGDMLAVVSDGLFEAIDKENEMFGHERLLNMLGGLRDQPAREVVDTLFAAIAIFADGMEQFDDQTCLVMKGIQD